MLTRPRTVTLLAAAAIAAAVAGCGGGDSPPEPPAPQRDGPATIDERAGRYEGIGIGSGRADFRQRFGEIRSGLDTQVAPLGERGLEVGTPPTPREPRGAEAAEVWRFEGGVAIADRGQAWLVSLTLEDARTAAGVGVGSALEDVREAYSGARCGTENEGTGYVEFPICQVEVAPERFLYFAYDPVRSVSMSRSSMTQYLD